MTEVILDRPEDVVTVMQNWHDNVLDTLTHFYNEEQDPIAQVAYSTALALLDKLPINSTFSVNEQVMEQVSLSFEDADFPMPAAPLCS